MASGSGNEAGDRDGAEGASGAERLSAPPDAAREPRLPFPVVGVGASAGGLEAYTEFLQACPADAGMAYVLVQHLPPDRESLLAEILARHTAMPVREVADGQRVEPDHVYVIRPGRTLTLHDGRLRLSEPLAARGHGRPVDDFFRSLAEEQQQRAVAVVFSGMGSNGTAGAQAVKAVGGLVVAQEPDSARFPAMPRSVIDAHLPDFILRPAEVPEALARYAGHPYAAAKPEPPEATARDEQALADVLAVLRTRTRHDFSGYRKPTIRRRVLRRVGLGQFATLAEYARALRQRPAEVTALADDLLIHVTGFFRDPEAWAVLREKVIDPLVAARATGEAVRCWVAACATGEEAYTLAMLLVEAAEAAGKWLDLKVFATDMAERALGAARAGVFPNGVESEVSPERLARFFEKDDSFYRVRKDLREIVVFAPQNILQDPPFSRLDIATCRNLLIYLEPDTQRRVLALLHFGLREGGALLLGSSESATPAEGDFEPIDKKHRLFRRVGPARVGALDLPAVAAAAREVRKTLPPAPAAEVAPVVAHLVTRALLDRYTPPAVAVDAAGLVVHVHGDTSRYLSLPAGGPTHDVFALANDQVRAAVRAALHKAAEAHAPAVVRDGLLDTPDGRRRVEVGAAPLGPRGAPAPLYLVTFHDYPDLPPPPADAGDATTAERLAEELWRTRHELQGALEEMQSSNEELKASHEEATSLNEELQSTNEELETSKEELQSLNEELVTVNAQLQAKMAELEVTNSDLSSLLTSTDIAVLFLDPQFRIRRFTPAVKDLLDLIPSDVGRPLADLRRKFTDPELAADARAVLDKLVPVERPVESESGRHYLRRVLPYRTQDSRIDGVVVAFVDVTERRTADAAVRVSEEQFRRAIEDAPIPVLMQAEDGQVLQLSRTWTELTGYALPDVPAASTWMTWAYGPGADALRAHAYELFAGERQSLDVEFVIRTKGGGERLWSFSASAPGRLRDGRRFLVGMAVDVTARRQAEEALRAGEERLRLAVAAGGLGTWDWDVRTGRVVWNDEHFAMQGYAVGEVAPSFEAWLAHIHPDDRAAAEAAVAAARDTRTPYRHDFRSLHPDGTVRWLSSRGVFFYDGAGPVRMIGVVRDVTDLKATEAAARRSEDRLRLALAAARMGIWTLDPDTGAHTRDANLNRLLGLAPAETTQPFAAFLAHIHPDDRGRVQDAFHHSLHDGRPLNVEFRVVRPDGAARWLHDQGDVFGDAAAGRRVMAGACVDVTERAEAEAAVRASEERLRLILASATDYAIFTLAADRTVTGWSPGAAATFGYAEGEIVGRSADVLFTPEDRAAGAPQQEADTARRDGRAADERWHLRADGSRFYASGVLTPKATGGFVKVLRDLTERKRAEDELRAARDRLEQRVEERTAELSGAIDALETEMTRRRATALRLSTAQEDERKRVSRDLHDTVGQTHAALTLALKAAAAAVPAGPGADKLAYAAGLAETMGKELHEAAVRLRPTALDDIGLSTAAAELVTQWSARTGVVAEFKSTGLEGGRLPIEVETALYRVIQEAMTNVARHARARTASVTVSRAEGEARAVVEDDGVGFDPEAGTTRLGLAGMRERVELVGGTLEVESAPGAGTTVVARVPLKPAVSSPRG